MQMEKQHADARRHKVTSSARRAWPDYALVHIFTTAGVKIPLLREMFSVTAGTSISKIYCLIHLRDFFALFGVCLSDIKKNNVLYLYVWQIVTYFDLFKMDI